MYYILQEDFDLVICVNNIVSQYPVVCPALVLERNRYARAVEFHLGWAFLAWPGRPAQAQGWAQGWQWLM